MEQKDKVAVLGTVGAVILLIGVAYGVYYWQPKKNLSKMSTPPVRTNTTTIPATKLMRTVRVYFHNKYQDPAQLDCNQVFPTVRSVPDDADTAFTTLMQLFRGPTETESEQGFTSFFSSSTAGILQYVKIENGIAYVDLVDIRNIIPNASTSCGSANFLAEIGQTLKDLTGVSDVRYAIFGDPKVFYEWMQIGCSIKDQKCDAAPFAEWYQK